MGLKELIKMIITFFCNFFLLETLLIFKKYFIFQI